MKTAYACPKLFSAYFYKFSKIMWNWFGLIYLGLSTDLNTCMIVDRAYENNL